MQHPLLAFLGPGGCSSSAQTDKVPIYIHKANWNFFLNVWREEGSVAVDGNWRRRLCRVHRTWGSGLPWWDSGVGALTGCRWQGQGRNCQLSTGRRLVHAGSFSFFSFLRLIQASLGLVAVFRPQAPKASRIIDLKVWCHPVWLLTLLFSGCLFPKECCDLDRVWAGESNVDRLLSSPLLA